MPTKAEKEAARKAEADRKAAEKKAEAERKAAEKAGKEAARKAEADRKAAEKAAKKAAAGRHPHLLMVYFSPYQKPLGARIVVNTATRIAYASDPACDQLAAEGKISTDDMFDGKSPAAWARSQGLVLLERPGTAEELGI